jgi:TolB-like protein
VSRTTGIRIGQWTANPDLNLIERGTRSVRIEPRAMDVLVYLAGRNEAVVSIEELMAAVWKGAVVGDGSVLLGFVAIAALVVVQRDGALAGPHSSVAVLPFDNLSSDPEQEYFAEGITVEVLNGLSRIRDLRVTGRASAFHFKDTQANLPSIGKALGVEHILEGSVRRSGNQLRIAAQLSNAQTGQQLWSSSYERRFDDIFLIQDEIAQSVAEALQVRLGVGELGRLPGMTRNVAAYDEYLRGMSRNLEMRPESFPPAIAHLHRAVSLDPTFSLAWAGLSTLYTNGAMLVPRRAEEWRSNATEALARARALAPDTPHVLLEIGVAETRRGRWLEAAAFFDQLQSSYRRYGVGNQSWGPRGAFLLGVGRVREAIPALERARAEEPLAPAFATFLSLAESGDGDLDAALAEIDRGLRLEGLDTTFRVMGLVIALTRNDRTDIARRLDAMEEGGTNVRINRRMASYLDERAGAAAEIRRLDSEASQPERTMLAHWAAFYGETDLSLELLSRAAPGLGHPAVLWQPLFRRVRGLPAFRELVQDMGFVEYWRTYGWSDFCQPMSGEEFSCG